jgi:ATP-binding cassette subfamily B protein
MSKLQVSYRDVAAFTWHYWHRQKIKLAMVIAGMTAAAIVDSAFPYFTGKMIDAIGRADTQNIGIWQEVMPYFLIFVGIGFLYHLMRNGTLFIWNRVAVQTLYNIENEAFQKVQRFSSDWHANAFAGGTVRKITRGKNAFDMFEDIIVMNLLPSLVVLVFTVVFTASKSWLLGGVTLACALIYMGINIYIVMKVNMPRFQKSAQRDTAVGARLADSITSNAVVKTFGGERREDTLFENVMKRWRLRALRSWDVFIATDLLRRFMSEIMATVMIGTTIYLWSTGQATAGDVVFSLTSFMLLSMYLRALGDNVSNLQRAINDMEDIILFWKREDEMRDAPDAKPIIISKGEIVFDSVRFMYRNKIDALFDDMNVTIHSGEKVALVGPSGSGKSSFVKLVQRLYDVDCGAILIDGQNIAAVTQESLRQNIALVPQEPVLFHRSIASNIAYAKPRISYEKIIEAAKLAHAHDFIQSLPQGYDTMVGERGVKLSGGERQRVAIARALLADCPILILDEATASLDSVSEHYIQLALQNLMKGRTTITVAHRLSTIQNADRILVFQKGKIVEQGRHADLISRPQSVYKELYEMQALDLVGEPQAKF